MNKIIKVDSIEKYNELYGVPTRHPLVSVVDAQTCAVMPSHITLNYGIYAVFLKNVKCGDLRYGLQEYDFQAGTVVCFAPGQVVEISRYDGVRPESLGVLFHPDFIHGTSLGRHIKEYSFFSYTSKEALHVSDMEEALFRTNLENVRQLLDTPSDKYTDRLIINIIELILNNCLLCYDRQFATRSEGNKNVLVRFESLIEEYLHGDKPRTEGFPTVKYFADQTGLSPNYFGDLIKKETGETAQFYIRSKLLDAVKETLLSTDLSVKEIAYRFGFNYPQHLSRLFKKNTGLTLSQYKARRV